MDTVVYAIKLIWDNYDVILGGLAGIMLSAGAIASVIPGEHPDKEIDAVANFLKKFSRK